MERVSGTPAIHRKFEVIAAAKEPAHLSRVNVRVSGDDSRDRVTADLERDRLTPRERFERFPIDVGDQVPEVIDEQHHASELFSDFRLGNFELVVGGHGPAEG